MLGPSYTPGMVLAGSVAVKRKDQVSIASANSRLPSCPSPPLADDTYDGSGARGPVADEEPDELLAPLNKILAHHVSVLGAGQAAAHPSA